jgi:zinc transporter, ZIP family
VIMTTTGIAACLLIGATIGLFVFAGQSPTMHAVVLAFSASALTYLVVDELLVRGHNARDTAGTVAFFFAGFIGIAGYTFLTR